MGPVAPCMVSLFGPLRLGGTERRAVLDEHRGLNLLVVCAANVCRSPLAEYLLAKGVESLPEFEGHSVSSAGGTAQAGSGICVRVGERLGVDGADFAAAHRSRMLTIDEVRRSGLVLTASKAERAAVARLDPSARSRTFTLREAASLAAAGPVGIPDPTIDRPLEAFAAVIHARRGLTAPPPREAKQGFFRRSKRTPVGDPLDIADGHVLGTRPHLHTLDEVAEAVDVLIGALRASQE